MVADEEDDLDVSAVDDHNHDDNDKAPDVADDNDHNM